jgi:hypothetical protein
MSVRKVSFLVTCLRCRTPATHVVYDDSEEIGRYCSPHADEVVAERTVSNEAFRRVLQKDSK